jgi:hypothetical protein
MVRAVTTSLCLASNSKILTPQDYQAIQYLRRGDEVNTAEGSERVARVIRKEMSSEQEIEIVILPPSSLEVGLPQEKILACSEHYLIYRSQRWLAKSFLPFPAVTIYRGPAKDILPEEEPGRYYLYDLQFDCESSYIVSGLLSQSRSPYCQVTPLPKELYFRAENYREERVRNTLRKDPPISYNYLWPNGAETETFVKIFSKES